jgi:hypothetical protein
MNKEIKDKINELYDNPITRAKVTKLVKEHINANNKDDLDLADFNYLKYNEETKQYNIDNYLIYYIIPRRDRPKRIWKIDTP